MKLKLRLTIYQLIIILDVKYYLLEFFLTNWEKKS